MWGNAGAGKSGGVAVLIEAALEPPSAVARHPAPGVLFRRPGKALFESALAV
jgi:hypothetical protein